MMDMIHTSRAIAQLPLSRKNDHIFGASLHPSFSLRIDIIIFIYPLLFDTPGVTRSDLLTGNQFGSSILTTFVFVVPVFVVAQQHLLIS
jgi:hypothetical protein